MIEFRKGDIFESQADILVCPVNCVGVMGKGLAKAFKERFEGLFEFYKQKCEIEEIHIFDDDSLYVCVYYTMQSQSILLIPTKKHWRDKSKLRWIENGIEWIADLLFNDCQNKGYHSIAIPALGCGCGELNWADVKPLFEKYLSDLPNEIYVYEPICNTVS